MYFSIQDGKTALMMASSKGHVSCVELLLNNGADADRSDKVRCSVTSVVY